MAEPLTIGEVQRLRKQALDVLLSQAVQPQSQLELGPATFDTETIKNLTHHRGLEDRLQAVKDQRLRVIEERLRNPLFRERLLAQGIDIDPEVIESVLLNLPRAPMSIEPGVMSLFGAARAKEGQPIRAMIFPETHLFNQLSEAERKGERLSTKLSEASLRHIDETVEHELEHVLEFMFNPKFKMGEGIVQRTQPFQSADRGGLVDLQRAALRKIGTEDLSHVRLGILKAREFLGKENLTEEDVLRIATEPLKQSLNQHPCSKEHSMS